MAEGGGGGGVNRCACVAAYCSPVQPDKPN